MMRVFIIAVAAAGLACAQSAPCSKSGSFTTPTSGVYTVFSQVWTNTTAGCYNWRVSYVASGLMALTVDLQYSDDGVIYQDFPPSATTDGTNPSTALASGTFAVHATASYIKLHISMDAIANGGKITYQLWGANSVQSSASASTGAPLVSDAKYNSVTQACNDAQSQGFPLALSKEWALNTITLNCTIYGMAGGILKPNAGQTITVAGPFTDQTWSQHVDLSAGAGAQVLFTGGGYLTMDTWGADSSVNNSTDSSAACTSAYAALTADAQLKGYAAELNLKPGGTYHVNSCNVQGYVRLRGNGAAIRKMGTSTNGVLYMTPLPFGTLVGFTILEDVTVVGTPSVACPCVDLNNVEASGYTSGLTVIGCGTKGISITNSNVYALRQNWVNGNGTNQVAITGSNDITIDNLTAETGPLMSAGDVLSIVNSTNTVIKKLHCESGVSTAECVSINGSTNTIIEGIASFYTASLTTDAVVGIHNTAGQNSYTTITGLSTQITTGTVTLTNLILDNANGYNIPGGTSGPGGFTPVGYYSTSPSTFGGPLDLRSGGTLPNNRSVSGVLTLACGGTTSASPACSNGNAPYSVIVVVGAVQMTAQTAVTVTGVSPAFTNSGTYSCFASDQGNTLTARVLLVSGSSFQIVASASNSDLWPYTCIGY